MLFSGYTVFKGCTECDFEFSRTQPTSILFVIALVGMGTAVLLPGLAAVHGSRWWYWVAVPIAELLAIFLLMVSGIWLRDKMIPIPAKCPRCSGEMESKGAGFHDGCLPSGVEFLVLLLVAAAHVFVAVWLR
jgi:hypothetical protein